MKPHSKPAGRPSKYTAAICDRARSLAEAGAVDQEIAGLLGIGLRTLYAWKAEHADFASALQRGKDVADDMVEAALFRRATGYSFDSVKIITVPQGANQGSEVREVPFVEHVPPETTAAMFWLKNRRSDRWREKQAVEHSGTLSLAELVGESYGRQVPPSNSSALITPPELKLTFKDTKQ